MSGLSSEMQIKEELLVRVIHLPLLKQPPYELWKGVSSILSQESELFIKKKVIGRPLRKTRNTNINVTNEMAEPVSLKKNQKGSAS